MKYLIIFCMLFASCSIFKKSVNTQRQDVSKSNILLKDSTGSKLVEEFKMTDLTQWGAVKIDSNYDKVTDELIKDYGDSIFTIRTIKEKGQKRTEQLSHTSKYDSAASMITEHSQLQELQQEDSTAMTTAVQKDIGHTTFFPWWILFILFFVAAIAVWAKRNPLIEFFKLNNKS